jgi:hypothetical protein
MTSASLLTQGPVYAAGVRLVYLHEPGATCGDEASLRAAVVAELHEDPFAEPTRYAVTAQLRRVGARLRARIVLEDFDGQKLGTRELGGRDCEELVPAMAWVIALAVGPLSHGEAPADVEAPAATPPPPVEITRPLPALEVVPPPAPHAHRLFWLVGVGEVAALNAGANVAAPGFTVSVSAVMLHFSMGVELRGDLPGAASTDLGLITTSRLMGSLVPCGRFHIFAACALASFGADRTSFSSATFYAGLGGRFAVEMPVYRRLWMRLHGDVLATLTHLDAYASLERFYRISGALGWALLLQFP